MLGIIVQLALSWLIVWLVAKRNLSVLGLRPTTNRLSGFLMFFMISIVCCGSAFIMKILLGGQGWHINPVLDGRLVFEGFRWNLVSVLFEELIFRGVLLYLLIIKLGSKKAVIISAIAFGIYHWFSFGILGQIVPMIFIFLITGTMGLLLAYAYSKTFSLYIPIAIHFGWNLTQAFIFSEGPIGNGIFVPDLQGGFRTNSMTLYLVVTILPMLTLFVSDFLLLKRKKQVPR